MRAQEPLFAFATLGLPCMSVPTAANEGVPFGIQSVATRFREDLCLDAAEIIEAQARLECPILSECVTP